MSPMIVTGRHLSRRTVLRGIGTAIALPLLGGMVPAFAASPRRPWRLGAGYLPTGTNMDSWTPATAGTDFVLPQILQPLSPYRDRVVVLSGMSNMAAHRLPGEGTG